jgi:hypothetical protein
MSRSKNVIKSITPTFSSSADVTIHITFTLSQKLLEAYTSGKEIAQTEITALRQLYHQLYEDCTSRVAAELVTLEQEAESLIAALGMHRPSDLMLATLNPPTTR